MSEIWQLNLEYTGQHCIKQKYENETCTIMDDAAYDSTTEWNEEKLRAINACRLYHGVTFPSDLLLYNQSFINKEYLFGNSCMRRVEQQER